MKRVLSGIQPSGEIHIGNYLGAIKQWVAIGEKLGRDAFFCIVDYHALTNPLAYDPSTLAQRTFEAALVNIAAGLDPEKVTLFVQSHVPEHTELSWVFTTLTPLGDLTRMTQFKDKASKQATVWSGLLMYPVLQAADILIYKADTVPVGEDLDQGGLLPFLLGEEGPFRGELQHQKLGEEGEELAFRPEVLRHLGQGLLQHGEDGHLLWGKPAPPQGLPQGLRGPLKAGKGDADHRRTGRFLGRRRPTFSRTSSMVAWATALARLAPSKRASIT